MGPDEKPIDKNIFVEELSDRSWHIRASGIDAAKCRQSADTFEELDHDKVTDGERRRRRDQLKTRAPLIGLLLKLALWGGDPPSSVP